MKIKYLLAASAASITAAIVLPAPVAAQQITTGIEGTVTDESGNPIAGATVAITDTRTGATRTITTAESGNFTATGLTTGGPYTVEASAAGFEGQSISNITTTLQGNTDLTFSLTSGGGVITVSAARVQLTQLAVGPGSSFSGELLTAAPTFNRDVRDIIRFDPRVSLDRDDGGSGQDRISCLGGNDRGNAFTVDGITQGDIYGLNDTGFSSRSSTPIPFDAVRETSVQFAPFDVEYGNFTGCAINVVTRSGSNTFTGGGFFEYSDSGMRGDEVDGLSVAPIEPDKRWGVNLGGPIIPDRLFFFVAYEHQEAGESQDDGPAGAGYPNELTSVTLADFNEVSDILSSVYGIETGPLVTNRPFENDRYFARLDWQVNDDHRLEVTYQRLEESSTRPDDFSTTTSNGRVTGLNTFSLSGTESDYYSGRLYSQWSDVFSTELRYSRSEVVDVQDPVGGGEAQDENPIPRIIVGTSNGGLNGQILAGPGFSRAANDLQTNVDLARFTGNLDLDSHQIKFGFEYNKADLFNLFVQNATGTLYFQNIEALRQGILSNGTVTNPTATQIATGLAVGAEGNFSATGDVRDAAAAFQRTIYSAFVQDEFDISEGLSAVVGVRADWYKGDAPAENPTFVNRYAFSNAYGFSNLSPLFMPRFALTYDFADDFSVFSRAQLRGGVGIFSGGDPLVWFGNAFQNNGFGFATGTSSDAACGTGPIDVVANGQFTGLPECFQASASSQAARGLGDTQSINAAIEQPSVVRANVGFSSGLDFTDSGLFSGWSFGVDYIYSRYRNPLTLVDLSQTPDIRKGLNGYTIDGRPIYAAIDPTVAGCDATLTGLTPTPIWAGVTGACFSTSRDDELQLINSDGYESHVASVILSREFDRGVFTEGGDVFFSIGYAYTDAQDRRSMYNSTAGSNYDNTASFDRQDPAAARSFFSSKHNISTQLNFREEFFSDLSTRLSVSFVARSGRPYSLTFTGGGVFNDSASGFENALAYLPTGPNDPNVSPLSTISTQDMQTLADFAQNLDCAKDYVGQTIERNTCSNDWYFDLDLGFSQEIPGPGRLFGVNDRLRLYATFDNFLNLLDSGWNKQNRRQFAGLQDIAQVSGVDAQGRYIFTNAANLVVDEDTGLRPYDTDNQVNISSSVWRLKVGVAYQF
jgi:outer membrane receptor for ferrienterochelin and colicin